MNRVAIFIGSQNRGAGAERVLEYFLEGAVEKRSEICVLSPPSSSVSVCARDHGYDWIPWVSCHDGIVQNTRAFFRLIQNEGRAPLGDLVHAWHTRGLEWAWFLGRLWKVPCTGTLHDDPEPPHAQFSWLRRKIIRAASARLDDVGAVSDAVAQRCRELGWKRQVAILRNGLPDSPPLARKTGSPLRLGFLATGMLWKGIALLPDLVHRTEDLPLEWNLFGSRENTGPVLDRLCTSPRVHYFGHTSLDEALSRIDVLLHLSLNLDPYPTVLLEAARAGLPVIATATGGTPEIVDDGRTGFLVPPAHSNHLEDAIRHLFKNPAERLAMGVAARRKFEANFRVERMIADYFAFWNRLRARA